ncbi:MAG: efflux RND transporter periplasmic adaptor subunit [Hyphomicrobiaceae bacterium]|nr:efflux RND transporter periplasmic adaptor subunit [Hyphomicrobiaceae bacterium]
MTPGFPANWVAVGSIALAIGGCNADAANPRSPGAIVQPVQVMTVALEAPAAVWSYTGTIRPRFESDLGFRVGGKIVSRHVDIGQTVTPGQLIAKLDETDLRLSLEAQEAELRAAQTSQDQAVAAEGRFRTLLDKGHVAQAAFDQRRAAADEARSRVARAERNFEIARNQLGYARLEATAAGVVTALSVETGQVIAAGQTVARVAQLGELDVAVGVPEHMAASVQTAAAEASVWNGAAGQRITVALRELSPEADRVGRMYQARFALPQGAAFELGRTATVHLSAPGVATGQGPVAGRVVKLPLSAVMNDGRAAHVYVLDGETRVKRKAVTIASLGATQAVIAAGLETGERVVTMGVHRLDEGQPVRVVEQRARAE